jgi:hypothetical protein
MREQVLAEDKAAAAAAALLAKKNRPRWWSRLPGSKIVRRTLQKAWASKHPKAGGRRSRRRTRRSHK